MLAGNIYFLFVDYMCTCVSVPVVVYEPATMEVDGLVNYYIDGGVGDHFPIHCYDGKYPVHTWFWLSGMSTPYFWGAA